MGTDQFDAKPIWVDATNLVRWGLQVPTGVQRVEAGLLDLALKRGDIGVAIMDRRLNRIEAASARTLSYIRYLLDRQSSAFGATYQQRLKDELRYLDVQLKYGDASTARRWATVLAGDAKKNKFVFQLFKVVCKSALLLVTALRLLPSIIVLCLQFFVRRFAAKRLPWPVFIISYELYSSIGLSQAIRQAGLVPVHLIYDLIPIHFPELVSKRLSSRIEKLFRSILRQNEISIAISATVGDELSDWNDKAVKANYTRTFHSCPLGLSVILRGDGAPVEQLVGKPFAMFVSTFDLRKCHYLLVEVWGLLAARFPLVLLPDLVLIGRKSHGLGRVEQALRAKPEIVSKVHLIHDMNDQELLWCYRNATFGLFPSVTEGWGLGVSELLAYGVPVVHTDIPILHEAAQNLMPSAPAEDVMAWADVIEPLINDPAKLKGLRDTVALEYDSGTPDSFARCVFAYLQTLALQEQQSAAAPLKSPPNPHP